LGQSGRMPAKFAKRLSGRGVTLDCDSGLQRSPEGTPAPQRRTASEESATPAKRRKEEPSAGGGGEAAPGEAAAAPKAERCEAPENLQSSTSRADLAQREDGGAAGSTASPDIAAEAPSSENSQEDPAGAEPAPQASASSAPPSPKAKAKAKGKGKAKAKAKTKAKATATAQPADGDAAAGGADSAEQPAKRARKPKPEGPYTKYKEAGSIPEPVMPRVAADAATAGRAHLKVIAWNIGGLRGFLRGREKDLPKLIESERPDVLGLIEHKLQDSHDDSDEAIKALLEALPDYEKAAVHCSTAKKGYSGTAILLRKGSPKPLQVETCNLPSATDEGRLIMVEYEALFLVLSYVPNSGDGLKRLAERTGQWDVQLREKLAKLAAQKPTALIGDLNVAHLDTDIWNVEAPHIPKSAGTTVEERQSFAKLLDAGFVDAFRHIHPEVLGAFTYWSVRAGNRPKNRGLRLDYVVISKDMVSSTGEERKAALVDAFHLPDMSPGDHCPVGAVISM